MNSTSPTATKVWKITAQEDIAYRLASSYPKEGFYIAKGDSFLVLDSALRLLSIRKYGTKQRGRVTKELHEKAV